MLDLKKQIEVKKLKLRLSKANTAKEELELRIMEREQDIQRMKEHYDLQDKEIEKAQKELKLINKTKEE